MKRSIRLALAGVILLAGILLFVCLSRLRSTPLPTNPPRPLPEVETITARKGELTVEIPAQGVVEPVTVTRASAEVDGKQVFALAGRGMGKHLVVNSDSGLLRDSNLAATDKAVEVCPVGVILRKRVGFAIPVGQRRFDERPISAQALDYAPRPPGPAKAPGA